VEAGQYQNGSKQDSCFMLVLQRFRCHDLKKRGVVNSSKGVGQKGRMSSTTDRYRAGILDGHRDWQTKRF